MKTRMDKYTETPNLKSRSERNKNLYEKIKNADIDKFDVNSNATLLDSDVNSIDVNKIKDMLDRQYRNDYEKRISLEREVVLEEEERLIDTKEYDINVILENAKKDQNVNYEKERLKKIHDTQYDILKNLNIDNKEEEIEETEENILNLINTITALELKHKEESSGNTTALDLLSDLSDNDVENVYKTMELDKEKISEASLENLDEEDLSIEEKYDDFKELEKELKSNNVAIRVVVVIFLIIVLIIGVILVNNYFDLGLF